MTAPGHRAPTISLAGAWPLALLVIMASGLAGCAGRTPAPAPAAAPADGSWRGREEVRDAIALLNQGNAVEARARLLRVLRRQEDGVARLLLSQIDGDPQQMLGAEHYPYTLREGETLSTVAQRALGNPMLFYILARYNSIAIPSSVRPGQVILVPGRRPAPPPQRPTPRPSAPPPSANPRPSPATPAARPAPAPRRANPGQAARLRAQGLAALNGGQVNRAVILLRQALALDPGNAAIRNDLARAQRIQGTVRSRP